MVAVKVLKAQDDPGIGHATEEGNPDHRQLGLLPTTPNDDGDAEQAEEQGQRAAAIGRFTEPPDTQEVHPHGSGVLEQDSVGGGALGHRRDVGEVHGRETNHHHQHQAMPRKVAPP